MLTAATGDRKNDRKKDRDSGHAKRNYRKRRGGGGGGGGGGGEGASSSGRQGGTTETQTSVISAAYESLPDTGENGEVVYCSLQASRWDFFMASILLALCCKNGCFLKVVKC